MSVRSDLAAALKPLLPASIKIIYVPRSLDGIETNRPVCMLYREGMTKAPNGQGFYLNDFALWLISPNIDPNRAEDSLDLLLDQTIEALDVLDWLNWTNVERSTFGDNQAPAFKITLQIVTNRN